MTGRGPVHGASCPRGGSWEAVVDYWLADGDGTAGNDEAFEAHLFECEACTAQLERLVALAEAVRRHARGGLLRGAVAPAVLERLRHEGVGVRRYEIDPGGLVHCGADAADDLVVVVLRVPAAALSSPRLDALFHSAELGLDARLDDVPVGADGAVHWVEGGAHLRTLPAHILEIRLVAPGPGDAREVARYTLHHAV